MTTIMADPIDISEVDQLKMFEFLSDKKFGFNGFTVIFAQV